MFVQVTFDVWYQASNIFCFCIFFDLNLLHLSSEKTKKIHVQRYAYKIGWSRTRHYVRAIGLYSVDLKITSNYVWMQLKTLEKFYSENLLSWVIWIRLFKQNYFCWTDFAKYCDTLALTWERSIALSFQRDIFRMLQYMFERYLICISSSDNSKWSAEILIRLFLYAIDPFHCIREHVSLRSCVLRDVRDFHFLSAYIF